MDITQKGSDALIGIPPELPLRHRSRPNRNPERANGDILNLIRRFENILSLAPVGLKHVAKSGGHAAGDLVSPADDTGDHSQRATRDRNVTATEAYQMAVETAALVRTIRWPNGFPSGMS